MTTQPPAGDPPATPAASPPPASPESPEARLDAVEAKLDQQGDTLSKIWAAISGGKPSPAAGDPPAGDMQSAARAEIEKIQQAQAEADAKKADADWRAGVDEALKIVKERVPAEPLTGLRGALQRAFVGRPE